MYQTSEMANQLIEGNLPLTLLAGNVSYFVQVTMAPIGNTYSSASTSTYGSSNYGTTNTTSSNGGYGSSSYAGYTGNLNDYNSSYSYSSSSANYNSNYDYSYQTYTVPPAYSYDYSYTANTTSTYSYSYSGSSGYSGYSGYTGYVNSYSVTPPNYGTAFVDTQTDEDYTFDEIPNVIVPYQLLVFNIYNNAATTSVFKLQAGFPTTFVQSFIAGDATWGYTNATFTKTAPTC